MEPDINLFVILLLPSVCGIESRIVMVDVFESSWLVLS